MNKAQEFILVEQFEHGSFAICGQDNAIYIYRIFLNYAPEIISHKSKIYKVSKNWYDPPSVSVINALSLSSKSTFLCPVVGHWRWTCKHFSFTIWHKIKFCLCWRDTAVESSFFSWFWCALSFSSYGMYLLWCVGHPEALTVCDVSVVLQMAASLPVKFHWHRSERDSQKVLPEPQQVVSCLPALVCGTSVNFYAIQWPNQHLSNKVWITSLVGEEPSSKFSLFLGTLPEPKR